MGGQGLAWAAPGEGTSAGTCRSRSAHAGRALEGPWEWEGRLLPGSALEILVIRARLPSPHPPAAPVSAPACLWAGRRFRSLGGPQGAFLENLGSSRQTREGTMLEASRFFSSPNSHCFQFDPKAVSLLDSAAKSLNQGLQAVSKGRPVRVSAGWAV